MPTQSFLTDSLFITNYNNYSTSLTYMQQWANQVNILGTQIQQDPNFLIGLTPAEQSALSSAVLAASNFLKAVPIPISPILPILGK